MENQAKPILIPTDFTPVVEQAVVLGAKLAMKIKTSIVLVHIVKGAKMITDASIKVNHEAERLSKAHGVPITGMVREGTIFRSISKAIKDTDAELMIMGIHGAKGMQKVTGRWAVKVAVTSSVPVLMVPENSKVTEFQRIVFPLDYRKEIREKVGWAGYMAKAFDASIYVFRDKVARNRKTERKIRVNLILAEKHFNMKNVYYTAEAAVKDGKSFADQTLDYAARLKADMILINTTKGISLLDYLIGTYEEKIIAHADGALVMCVNPKKAKLVGGFSAMGG